MSRDATWRSNTAGRTMNLPACPDLWPIWSTVQSLSSLRRTSPQRSRQRQQARPFRSSSKPPPTRCKSVSSPASTGRKPMSPGSPIQAVNLGPNGSAFCTNCYLGRHALRCLSTRIIRFLLRPGLKTHGDPVRIVAETSGYARATFCESGKFKRQIGVMGLADLCLAPEGQTGNPAVAELETHHAELQSRTHPNYAGGP